MTTTSRTHGRRRTAKRSIHALFLGSLAIAGAVSCAGAPPATGTPQGLAPSVSATSIGTTTPTSALAPAWTPTLVAPFQRPTLAERPPCDRAAALREKATERRAHGALDRAARQLVRAAELCPDQAPAGWALLVATLAELGRYAEARALIATIEAAHDAPADAQAASKSAREVVAKLDKAFAVTDAAKTAMRRSFGEAAVALDRKDFRRAHALYLRAWNEWRPNGQALFGAGLAAQGMGDAAEAQRLFDRAVVDLERATGSKVAFDAPNGYGDPVRSPSWSGNGRLFAIAHADVASIFDVFTWREKVRISGGVGLDQALAVALSPDGKIAALAGTDGRVRLFDVGSGKPTGELVGHGSFVSALAFAPDGKHLVSAGNDATVRIWDLASLQGRKLVGHTGPVTAIAISSDGAWVASASEDHSARLWSLETGALVGVAGGVADGAREGVSAVAFDAKNKRLATASLDRTVRVYAITTTPSDPHVTLTATHRLEGHTEWLRAVAFSPDGHTVVSAGDDRTIRVWDLATSTARATLTGHARPITGLSFDPTGAFLASTARDGSVRLWNATTFARVRTLESSAASLNALAFAPDGSTLALAAEDSRVRAWTLLADPTGRATFRAIDIGDDPPTSLAIDGSLLIAGTRDAALEDLGLIDGVTHSVAPRAKSIVPIGEGDGEGDKRPRATAPIASIAVAPDGKTFATVGGQGAITLWSAEAHARYRTLVGEAGEPVSIAYAPDGLTLATGARDGSIRLWDLLAKKPTRLLHAHGDVVGGVAFSPDGLVLASASLDGTAKLWDVATGTPMRSFPDGDGVTSVAWSPDGRTVATGSRDRTIQLWDVASGARTMTLRGHTDAVVSVVFRGDGKLLASAGHDDTAIVWRLGDHEGSIVLSLRGLAGRDVGYAFTPQGDVELSGTVALGTDSRTDAARDADVARDSFVCRVGSLTFPFALCAERFVTTDLVARAIAGDGTLSVEP